MGVLTTIVLASTLVQNAFSLPPRGIDSARPDHIPRALIVDRVTQNFARFDTVYSNRNLRGLFPLEGDAGDDEDEVEGDSRQFDQTAEVTMVGQGGQIAYITQISVGDQGPFSVVIDTGSSDTWLIQEKFTCLDNTLQKVDNAVCRLGPGYKTTGTFREDRELHFSIQYGDGERLLGAVGNETVTLAGITVPNQRVNIVDNAAWNGDGVTSGLLGLGFPANTANYKGSKTNDLSQPVTYDPFFTSATKAGLVRSGAFAIALQREQGRSGKGYLAFGGVPPVQTFGQSTAVHFSPPKATARNQGQQTEYTVPIDGFRFMGAVKNDVAKLRTEALIDSGTSVLLAPAAVAKAYNALWDPDSQEAPPLSIIIAGQDFPIDPIDLRIKTANGYASAVLPSRKVILGDTFMRNVLSVFDVANSQMRFTSTNPIAGPANTLPESDGNVIKQRDV